MSTKFEQAIVRIYGQKQNIVGMGILVGKQHILTCAHVVAQALFGNKATPSNKPKESIKIDFPIVAPNEILDGIVVCWIPMQSNGDGDIAVLELTSKHFSKLQPVCLVENTNIWGHTVRMFGCPTGYRNGLWVSGEIKGRQASSWFQIESSSEKAVEGGFSGGGVWDEKLGGVFGIVTRVATDNVNISYIIPTDILIQNCPLLKEYIRVSPKRLGELYKIPASSLQTQLAYYYSRLPLSQEDDLLAIGLISLMLKSFNEASQVLTQLLNQNPVYAYAWYLSALAKLNGRRPWLLNYDEAVQIQSHALKALQLDSTQAHFAFFLALIKEDFFQKKGFRVEHPDLISCMQTALKGKLIKEELLILLNFIPVASSKVTTFIHTSINRE